MRALACFLTTTLAMTIACPATAAPDAREILDRMIAWYGEIPGAKVEVTMSMRMPGEDEMTSTTAVSVLKPNLFAVKSRETGKLEDAMFPVVEVISNGTTLWEAIPDMKAFAERPAPDGLSSEASFALQITGTATVVLDLMSKQAKEQIMEDFDDVRYGGTHDDGHVLDLIAPALGPGPPPAIKMYIGPDATPWMNRLTVEHAEAADSPPMVMSMVFKDWMTLADTPETRAAMTFTPKEGWKKVDNIADALMMDGPSEETGPHPMVGKPAPEFTLTSLGGDDVSLKSLRGKTVILDFWATWCGPCKQGLPVLMKVATDRADDGVVLWSVDLNETTSKVESFLKKSKWALKVLMDTKGSVASTYGVKGIPHTVVIDPEGVVRLVEIGFMGAEHVEKAMNTVIDNIKGG